MSQELFGEASQRSNNKQEARRNNKTEQEKFEGNSLMTSSALSYIIIKRLAY